MTINDKKIISEYRDRFGDIKPSEIKGANDIHFWICPECGSKSCELLTKIGVITND